jgi:hypothetical protein
VAAATAFVCLSLPRFGGRVSSWASMMSRIDAVMIVHAVGLRAKAVTSAWE